MISQQTEWNISSYTGYHK